MMNIKDYYKTLEINDEATITEIKEAYRRLAQKYHPDSNKSTSSESKFKEILEAYSVLKDTEKREIYDDERENSYSDASYSYENIYFNIKIDLIDTYLGVIKNIEVQIPYIDNDGIRYLENKTLSIEFSKGLCTGQFIVFDANKFPHLMGSNVDQIFFEVEIVGSEIFRVDGKNIHVDVPLESFELVSGAKILLNTPIGKVEFNVPENSKIGDKLRLKGKGIPSDVPGDLYAHVTVIARDFKSENNKSSALTDSKILIIFLLIFILFGGFYFSNQKNTENLKNTKIIDSKKHQLIEIQKNNENLVPLNTIESKNDVQVINKSGQLYVGYVQTINYGAKTAEVLMTTTKVSAGQIVFATLDINFDFRVDYVIGNIAYISPLTITFPNINQGTLFYIKGVNQLLPSKTPEYELKEKTLSYRFPNMSDKMKSNFLDRYFSKKSASGTYKAFAYYYSESTKQQAAGWSHNSQTSDEASNLALAKCQEFLLQGGINDGCTVIDVTRDD